MRVEGRGKPRTGEGCFWWWRRFLHSFSLDGVRLLTRAARIGLPAEPRPGGSGRASSSDADAGALRARSAPPSSDRSRACCNRSEGVKERSPSAEGDTAEASRVREAGPVCVYAQAGRRLQASTDRDGFFAASDPYRLPPGSGAGPLIPKVSGPFLRVLVATVRGKGTKSA